MWPALFTVCFTLCAALRAALCVAASCAVCCILGYMFSCRVHLSMSLSLSLALSLLRSLFFSLSAPLSVRACVRVCARACVCVSFVYDHSSRFEYAFSAAKRLQFFDISRPLVLYADGARDDNEYVGTGQARTQSHHTRVVCSLTLTRTLLALVVLAARHIHDHKSVSPSLSLRFVCLCLSLLLIRGVSVFLRPSSPLFFPLYSSPIIFISLTIFSISTLLPAHSRRGEAELVVMVGWEQCLSAGRCVRALSA